MFFDHPNIQICVSIYMYKITVPLEYKFTLLLSSKSEVKLRKLLAVYISGVFELCLFHPTGFYINDSD